MYLENISSAYCFFISGRCKSVIRLEQNPYSKYRVMVGRLNDKATKTPSNMTDAMPLPSSFHPTPRITTSPLPSPLHPSSLHIISKRTAQHHKEDIKSWSLSAKISVFNANLKLHYI